MPPDATYTCFKCTESKVSGVTRNGPFPTPWRYKGKDSGGKEGEGKGGDILCVHDTTETIKSEQCAHA